MKHFNCPNPNCIIYRNKHTNLPNEITGAYYEDKTSWFEIAAYTFGTLITLLAILDLFFPEVVTEVLSGVAMWVY